MAKEAYAYGKRDLLIWQQSPANTTHLRYAEVAKETYNRPKETYSHEKKRPTDMATEPC
jgi:hypothetical protein